MPQPTAGDVHVNRPLTNISIAYMQSADQFIASKVFPNIPSEKQGDRYVTYPKEQWFRTDAQKRGVAQESAGSGYEIDSTPTFFCEPIALHRDVDDQVRSNADQPIDMDRDATLFLTQQMMLKREKDWAAAYFTTGLWTGSSTGTDIVPGTLWDAGGSTPIADMRTEARAMKKKTGRRPNVAVLSEDVWDVLQDHSDFLDRIKLSDDKVVTVNLLAKLLGLDKIYIAGAVENTAPEGAAANMSFVYGKDVALFYANPTPSIMQPSAGYTFSWKGYLGASQEGMRIKRFRMEHLAADRVEAEMAYDQKLIASDLGVFFNGAIS